MMKYLRFEKAMQSKVYRELVDEAMMILSDFGVFAKQDVINRAGYDAIADDIRWDYVRRIIEDSHDTELIPLAPRYFKRHKHDEEVRFTELYVAKGNGKKTVGYATACEENGHFVIHRIKFKKKLADAFMKSAERSRQIGVRRGALIESIS